MLSPVVCPGAAIRKKKKMNYGVRYKQDPRDEAKNNASAHHHRAVSQNLRGALASAKSGLQPTTTAPEYLLTNSKGGREGEKISNLLFDPPSLALLCLLEVFLFHARAAAPRSISLYEIRLAAEFMERQPIKAKRPRALAISLPS